MSHHHCKLKSIPIYSITHSIVTATHSITTTIIIFITTIIIFITTIILTSILPFYQICYFTNYPILINSVPSKQHPTAKPK